MKPAFTLIELLVVITIIVVLLALLTPALDRAIYQAELAVCGARMNVVGKAVTTYAFENRRRYPFRDLPPTRTGVGNPEFVYPSELTRPVNTFDMRPYVRGVLDINKMLQCPMTEQLDLDQIPDGEWILTSYAMWWGWLYWPDGGQREAGMFKVGDRFAWQGDSYNVIVGDYDVFHGSLNWASHPDDAGLLSLWTSVRQNWEGAGGGPVPVLPLTMSIWRRDGSGDRGNVDMNYAFTDGSVQRYGEVEPYLSPDNHDRRMGAVPSTWRNMEPIKRIQVPR